MQTCPAEVLDKILSHLPFCHPETDFGGIHDLAALATTCRALSTHAQPLLFKSVLISDELGGRELLGLISANDNLSGWIKEIYVRAQDVRDHELSKPGLTITGKNGLPLWLGSEEGSALVSQLHSVENLNVSHLNKHDDNLQVLRNAWSALRSLRRIQKLKLHKCDLPSFQMAIELLNELASIHISNVCILSPPSPHDNKSAIQLPRLRTLSFIPAFWMDTTHVESLIGLLRCTALTALDLSSCEDGSDPIYPNHSFSYAQGLFIHLPALEKLVLRHVGNNMDPGTISLQRNFNIRHLAFRELNFPSAHTWCHSTIASLSCPELLEFLQLSGNMSRVPRETWHALDGILSDSRFSSESRDRQIVIFNRYTDNFVFPLDAFPEIVRLGWFNVRSMGRERVR